jgi:hypothetical protein
LPKKGVAAKNLFPFPIDLTAPLVKWQLRITNPAELEDGLLVLSINDIKSVEH